MRYSKDETIGDYMKKLFLIIIIFLVLCSSNSWANSTVTFNWQPNTETDLKEYQLYQTDASGKYSIGTDTPVAVIPAGTETTTLYHVAEGTWFWVLIAVDNRGSKSGPSNEATYTVEPVLLLMAVIAEVGSIDITQNRAKVMFDRPFTNPVVIAKPLSCNEDDPAVVRIGNVSQVGFEIYIQEWEYLDGGHIKETVGYIVMEQGAYILPGGIMVEAGIFNTDSTSSFERVDFNRVFNQVPVVFTAISSEYEIDTVTTRIRNVTDSSFEFCIQEQESNNKDHVFEITSYIAWEPSSGSMGGMVFEVGKTEDTVTHNWQTVTYKELFINLPVFFADMQTVDGGDTANLRWQNKNFNSIDVKIAEEQSSDSEIYHTTEVVGYIIIGKSE